MSYFDPLTWRVFSNDEMLAHLDNKKQGLDKGRGRKKKGRRKSGPLILHKTISTFDAYTYLHARFGAPNGLLTFVARDDSDNLFHWDYNLKAGDRDLVLVGATQEVHVFFDHDLSDDECWQFIGALKADFARVSAEKGQFGGSLEKWSIFPNQYLSLANRCADLYHSISTSLPKAQKLIGLVTVSCRSAISLCHLGFKRERADAAQI